MSVRSVACSAEIGSMKRPASGTAEPSIQVTSNRSRSPATVRCTCGAPSSAAATGPRITRSMSRNPIVQLMRPPSIVVNAILATWRAE
jgi:hypothetical protein